MKARLWTYSILVVLALGSLIWGPRSGYQWYNLKKTDNDLAQKIAKEKRIISDLSLHINDLVSNPFSQMRAIQDSLGYIKKNDLVFRFIPVKDDHHKSKSTVPH